MKFFKAQDCYKTGGFLYLFPCVTKKAQTLAQGCLYLKALSPVLQICALVFGAFFFLVTFLCLLCSPERALRLSLCSDPFSHWPQLLGKCQQFRR